MNPQRNGGAAKILKTRAQALAREPEKPSRPAQLNVVQFRLAEENYAVETAAVRDVCPLRDLTPLPGAPAFVLGIVNVRGQILAVIDLNRFFDLPGQTGFSEPGQLIRLQAQDLLLGFLANAVTGVRSIPVETIQALPAASMGLRKVSITAGSRGSSEEDSCSEIMVIQRGILPGPCLQGNIVQTEGPIPVDLPR